jgi:hypothetical protein
MPWQERLKMFARNISFRVKSLNMAGESARIFESEILPSLRKQEGFMGELTLSNPGSLEQIAISLWADRETAEAYNADAYPQVLKILASVIDGAPRIRTYDAVTWNVDHGTGSTIKPSNRRSASDRS